MRIIQISVLLVLALAVQSRATFLLEDLSASASGLAGAVTADSAGVKALEYNPAGLGQSSQYEAEFSHLSWIFGTSYDKISVVSPFLGGGAGLSLWAFHPLFDKENSLFELGQSSGTFDFYDMNVTAGYGLKIFQGLTAGGAFQFIQNSVMGQSVNAASVSGGVAYQTRLVLPWWPVKADNHTSIIDKGNFRAGATVHNIKVYGSGEVEDPVIRAGISVNPIPYIKVSADSWMGLGSKSPVQTAAGVEARYLTKRGGGFLRGGMQLPDTTLFAGFGVQGNYSRNFYRIDFAYNTVMDQGDVTALKGISWFSFSMGRLPLLLNMLQAKALLLSPSVYDRKDSFVEKTSVQEKVSITGTGFKVYVEPLVSQDEYIKAKQYDVQLRTGLQDHLEKAGLLAKKADAADLVISAVMKSEGELLLVNLTGTDPDTRSQLAKNAFELNIKFQREALSKSEILSLGLHEESGRLSFVREREAEESDEEFKKIDLLAVDMGKWVVENLTGALSAEWMVKANLPDVDVYVDGAFFGKTAKNGDLVLQLVKGKHSLSFIKENCSRVLRQAVVVPGLAGSMDIMLEENVFFADLDIKTFPGKARIWLDGKLSGESPVVLSNVRNGAHQVAYELDGVKWSEQVNVTREGRYKLYSLRKYTDVFKKLDPSFWDVTSQESGYQVSFKNHLDIEGTSSDDVWGGAGLVSRQFTMNDLEMKADIKLPEGKQKIMLGIIDANGRGVAASGNNRNFQLVRLGDEAAQSVPVLPFPDKKLSCLLAFKWKKDGTLSISIDDHSLINEKYRMDLSGTVRIFLLSDADKINEKGAVEIGSITIQN